MAFDLGLPKVDLTPENRFVAFDATTTLALWTPRSGNRLYISRVGVQGWTGVAAGTFTIFLGTTNSAPARIAEVGINGSSIVEMIATGFESTGVDYILYGRPSQGGTRSHMVFIEGCELQ